MTAAYNEVIGYNHSHLTYNGEATAPTSGTVALSFSASQDVAPGDDDEQAVTVVLS